MLVETNSQTEANGVKVCRLFSMILLYFCNKNHIMDKLGLYACSDVWTLASVRGSQLRSDAAGMSGGWCGPQALGDQA